MSLPAFDHVVVVILENHAYSQIVGSANAPYINGHILRGGAVFSNAFGIGHPSQPNYLALFSGSTQGVTDNTVPAPGSPFSVANLATLLNGAGRSWAGFYEDMPSVDYLGSSTANYVRRHNPSINFKNCTGLSLPFTSWPTDFTKLPTVSFVVPNLENDMHDGTIAQGDTWLQTNMDSYLSWARAHNSIFILTFDEADNSHNNNVLMAVAAALVIPGTYSEHLTHYDILRTLCDMYDLQPPGNARSARAITDIWSSRKH
jgi:phosphatidylinositol-3-phosphatase